MNKKRRAEWERAYGSHERLAWGYSLGCLVVGCETLDCRPYHDKIIECAHTASGGTGRKADYDTTVFVCWRHHDRGVNRLHETYEISVNGVPVANAREGAKETERQWVESCDG